MIKLIIWDLDGILWESSVGETNSTGDINHKAIQFIKQTEECGIIHSVCSKNNLAKTKPFLESLGIWNLFVFPVIEYLPKGPAVKKIIESCQLNETHVLFVDDNTINTNEVKYFCPDINVENTTDFIDSFDIPQGKSRTEQYKILELKSFDKDNLTFLQDSDIKISITNNNNCFLFYDRICELVNRSNRLNFTKTRFPCIDDHLMPYAHIQNRKNYVVFAWDKYGYYGLIGYFSTDEALQQIEHFVFSCRVLDMGIENYCADYIKHTLKIPFDINIPHRDVSYIEHVDFEIASKIIDTKEELKFSSDEPKVKIYAGCLSLPIWSSCKTNYIIQPMNFGYQPHHSNIEDNPELIIISIMNELMIDPGSLSDYIYRCNRFIEIAIEHKKSILLLIPESLGKNYTNTELEIYDFWNKLNLDSIYVPLSSEIDHTHFTRHVLAKLGLKIDAWVKNKLSLT